MEVFASSLLHKSSYYDFAVVFSVERVSPLDKQTNKETNKHKQGDKQTDKTTTNGQTANGQTNKRTNGQTDGGTNERQIGKQAKEKQTNGQKFKILIFGFRHLHRIHLKWFFENIFNLQTRFLQFYNSMNINNCIRL